MTSSTRVILDPKRASEIVSPPFDFSAKCQAGDELSSPLVTVTVWSGVDPDPQAVYGGGSAINGFVINPTFQGGIVGVIYLIAVEVAASLSGTLELDALLAILPQGL